MPLSLGFHPYFQLTDSPRDEWTRYLAARERVTLSDKMVPTGERDAAEPSQSFPLAGQSLDDVLTDLTGEEFSVQGGATAPGALRAKYPVAVVYAPPNGSFVCFEPMTAQTNAFNLTHAGIDAGPAATSPGEARGGKASGSSAPSRDRTESEAGVYGR